MTGPCKLQWLTAIQIYSLPVLEARGLKSRCQQGWFPWESLGLNLSRASLPAGAGWLATLVLLGLELYQSSVVTWPSLHVLSLTQPFYKDTSHGINGPALCKDPLPNRATF